MSKEIIKEGQEALKRALLMMNYDMKKTLTENVEVISEQANTNEISAGDLADIVDDAVDILDRDVETSDMEDLIELMKTEIFGKKFKGACAYDKFKKYYADNESWQGETFEDQVESSGEYNEQEFEDVKQEMLDLIKKEKQFCKTLSYTVTTTTKAPVVTTTTTKAPLKGGSNTTTQYTPCPANGPYKQGCKSDVVKKIQGCLGVKTTGNFGPLTQTALTKIGYPSGFTSADVENICKKGTGPVFASDNLVTTKKGI